MTRVPAHRVLRGVPVLAFALAMLPGPASGQAVEFRGRGDLRTDTMLKRVLGGDFRLFAADTVIAAADTLEGVVLVAGATVKFENFIRGDLVMVDANVFLRPGARVAGAVTSVAAGFFRAPSAQVDGPITELKDAPYRAEVGANGVTIRGTRAPALIDPDGFRGLLPPTHDRVNGAGLHGGIRLLLPRVGALEPEIRVRADYHAARERGGGSLELRLRSVSGLYARIGAQRVAATRDAWLRSDFANTVSFLVLGEDLHDWHDAERFLAAFGADFPRPAGSFAFELRAQVENAASLPARDPWHAWGDDPARPNPGIDDGRIASLELSGAARWSRPSFEAALLLSLERAVRAADADFAFTALELGGDWAMQALADHSYRLTGRYRGRVGGRNPLPRQRWSALGGRGTLPTLQDLQLRGDRMVFFSSVYSIPVRVVYLPALGFPAVELVHHFGSAWTLDRAGETTSGQRDLVQNLGLRLRFRLASLTGFIDPDRSGSFSLIVGIGRAPQFPWTPPGDR